MLNLKFLKTKPENKELGLVSFVWGDDSETRVFSDGRKEIAVGIGEKEKFNRRRFILAVRRAVAFAKAGKIKKIAIDLPALLGILPKEEPADLARLLGENLEMANFEFVKYKTAPEEGLRFVEEILFYGDVLGEAKQSLKKGQKVGDGVNGCRELSNTPGGEMTPAVLAEAARRVSLGTRIKVTVLNRDALEKMKMGGVLGVAKGSSEHPRFIIMEYDGRSAEEKKKSPKNGEGPIVFAGKGVTFDTGGLNLKPGDSMQDMHMDMSGGAAVIYAIALAARLDLKVHAVGLVPAVENSPSGESFRPGDILRSLSGKTIEVLNTDAEGRIILADALHYAKKYNPRFVIDVATLTGAAMAALGQRCSALFSNNVELRRIIEEAGEASGDYVWSLPLWEEYDEEIKGTFGDVANVGKTRYGGAITAAAFLKQFVEGLKWAHLDIAPKMTSIEGEYLAKGASGAPARLLVRVLEKAETLLPRSSLKLSLSVLPQKLAVCRLDQKAEISDWLNKSLNNNDFFSLTRTNEELSLVCLEEKIPAGAVAERNWRVLKVKGPLDFSLTGILASLVSPLAEARISIFAASTYETDYIFVKEEFLAKAVKVLKTFCDFEK